MTIAPFRACFLVVMFSLVCKRTFSFRSSHNALQLQTTKGLWSLKAASSSGDPPVSATNCPPQEEQQPKKQPPQPRAAVSIALRCLCGDPNTPQSQAQAQVLSEARSPQPQPQPHYLLIRRGNEPNKGKWALPGGKLEWGETALEGAKRELSEEVIFGAGADAGVDGEHQNEKHNELAWCPQPYTTADAISLDQGFHYLIAVCFAELKLEVELKPNTDADANFNEDNLENPDDSPFLLPLPPRVTASDDAMDAKWWSMDEIMELEDDGLLGSPGFVKGMKRTEFLYQKGVLQTEPAV